MTIAGTEQSLVRITRGSYPLGALQAPSDPSEEQRLGASELNAYVRKIANCELPVAFGQDAKRSIIKITDWHLDPVRYGISDVVDGSFHISTNAGRVEIAGIEPGGVLNGVYAFLEMLGVRWFMPGELGEEVPKRADIEIEPCDIVEQPAFEGRHILSDSEWGRHNKMGGPIVSGGQHWYDMLPTREYFREHPEYFALMKGKRVPNVWNKSQVCTSNPEVARIFAQRACCWFEENPTGVLSLSPNDNEQFCECADCLRIDPSARSRTDRVVEFLNRVAEIVAEKYPDRLMSFLAYRTYSEPPVKTEIHPNLVPQVARFEGDLYYPLTPVGRRYLREWRSLAAHLATYEFVGHYSWFGLLPMVEPLCDDFRFYKRIGVDVVAGEIHPHWATQGLNLWAAARLLWNVDLDAETIIDDYCSGMFHSAASHMRDFYWLLEEKAHPSAGGNLQEVWTQSLLCDLSDCLSAAVKVANGIALQRVVFAMLGLEYTKAAVNSVRAVENAPNNAVWQMEQALKIVVTAGEHGFEQSLVPRVLNAQLKAVKEYTLKD